MPGSHNALNPHTGASLAEGQGLERCWSTDAGLLRVSDLQQLAGQAGSLGLQPEEVLGPEELPLMAVRALHRLKVPPRTLPVHHRALQLLGGRRDECHKILNYTYTDIYINSRRNVEHFD